MATLTEKERELTALENRIAFETNKMKDLQKQSEKLQSDISEKRTQYELFMNQRDAETKKAHNDILADREKLESDKAEFVKILNDLNTQKNKLEADKHAFESEKQKIQGLKDNLDGCITAIRRAVSLIS